MSFLTPSGGPVSPFLAPGAFPLIVAHRGFSGAAPENTLAAFRKALEADCDMIELDVQLTREGEVVVIHDDSLERTTDGRGFVYDRSLGELQSLDAGGWFHRSAAGERVPTLEEVLDFARDRILLNIEIKREKHPRFSTERLADRAWEEVKKAGMEGQVLFSSFEGAAIERIQGKGSSIPTAFITKRSWARIGDLPGGPLLACLNGRRDIVTQKTVDRTHADGVRVMVWTVDEPRAMRRFVQMGVDGIITNHPNRLREIRESRRTAKDGPGGQDGIPRQ